MAKKFTPGKYDLRRRRSRAGFGLFTYSPIKRGACVVQYQGRRLTKTQDEKSQSMYLFYISKNKTIDGWIPGNKARYINHSCRPNCEIDIHKGRVYVLAKRNIESGEELNYDYDTEYFNAYIKPKGCKCQKCAPELHAEAR